MIVFPNAKINIGLNVVSKRDDGYHNLETIFFPVKLADALEFVEAEETKLTTSGIVIEGIPENNLVLKAYQLLKADFNLPPLHFHLHKVVPFGAGLGGGSSDAAFTLKTLNEFYDLGLTTAMLEKYAAQIGADCPFFIHNKPTFATGIGNRFHKIELDLSGYEIVILKPDVSVSTPEAYKNVIPRNPKFRLTEIVKKPVNDWKNLIVNDFENSVFPKYPQIAELKQFLYKMGADFASMSGSGSAVFGIFRHLPANLENKIPSGILLYR
ncbi:MAG: 4-(cytidine 5'-diphospho)-2-C-methyl-D-erythritol kinase [Bacteroidetes bacterium]|nr:MAG: 4-(cytidine 5'-diphospho)-2-C-methyl-D-erythritol kinase [Bacteroidota bacterium]